MERNKFDEKILEKFRKLLFPQIGKGIITGYNVYLDRFKGDCPFIVNYLHSDLGYDKKRMRHRHYNELIEKLSGVGEINTKQNVVNSVVDRVAIYRRGDWEEDPGDVKIYDSKGNLIQREYLRDYEGILIAEGNQYDLGMKLEDPLNLNDILNIFNEYTYAKKVNSRGIMTDEINDKAIYGAWKFPLIVITTKNTFARSDYRRVFDILIRDKSHEISTLVRKNLSKFEEVLVGNKTLFEKIKKYANRPFVELYLDGKS